MLEVEVKGNQISGQYIPINGSGGTVYFETFGPAGDDLLKQMKEKRVNFKFISSPRKWFLRFFN